jgi:hypothetical protein
MVVYAPTNLLMAQAVFTHMHPDRRADIFILSGNPVAETLLKKLASSFSEIEQVKYMSWEQGNQLLAIPDILSKKLLQPIARLWLQRVLSRRLRLLLANMDYNTLLYPHDTTGECQIVPIMKMTWPAAELVCYGDAFGIFYDKRIHLGLLGIYPPLHPLLQDVQPNRYAGALPIDAYGSISKEINVTVVPKQAVIAVLQQARLSFPELGDYLSFLQTCFASRPKALLLTENHAEANFISFENEVAMYADIILAKTSSDTIIILKSHPCETLTKNAAISVALEGKRECLSLDDRFKLLPIEMMSELVSICESCICMSYPRLSLAWLFGKEVINPMRDKSVIQRWFKPETWISYEKATALYEEPLKRLPYWTGEGLLWSGRHLVSENLL